MNDNIISINVPNGVSILIMAAFGGLILAAAKKFMANRAGAAAATPGV